MTNMDRFVGLEQLLASALLPAEAQDVADRLVPWLDARDKERYELLFTAVSQLRKPIFHEDGRLVERDEDGMYILTPEECDSEHIQKQVTYNLTISDALLTMYYALGESS